MRLSKTKKISLFYIFLALVAATLTLFSASAMDYQFEQVITDSPTQIDVCPNIPGPQASIPSGMQLDTNGNCYTPTVPNNPSIPPQPPVPVDLCYNINGNQFTLPYGYYRTVGGNCYRQPAAPQPAYDVCSNIDGLQASMPDSYYLKEDNTCDKLPEPEDVCDNIPGPQEILPEGMVVENGECSTPEPKSPIASTNNKNSDGDRKSSLSDSKEILFSKSVPGFLRPIVGWLVSIVPENIREWLQELPDEVAETVPIYIFVIVVMLALIPILQSIREAIFVRQLAAILKREKDIAEQKDNFIALASHHLRTPLTLMKNGVDSMKSENIDQVSVSNLESQIGDLDLGIKNVLQEVENNTTLRNIPDPQGSLQKLSVWRSGWFWGPIIGSIVLTIIANFLLVIVGNKEVKAETTFLQFVVAAVAFIILYLAVRNYYLQKKLRDENQILINHEKTIDEARNSFINNTTFSLQNNLDPINQSRQSVQGSQSAKFINEGYDRMQSMLEKFLLLSQVRTGAERELEVFDIHEAIDNLLVTHQAAISEKRITVANTTSVTFIKQNRLLFNFVLSSILDNAIKFNQPGGNIEISATPNNKSITIKISDNGIGMEKEKLGQLFKPFSRATSAIEFNYEGLGFSLFLNKIIMDYTGGTIGAASSKDKGTQVFVSAPVSMNS